MRTFQPSIGFRLLLLAALALAPACNRSDKPVLRVGEETVGQVQWKLYLSELPKDVPAPQALDRLLRREVAWQRADRMGLLKSAGWQEVGPKLRRAALIRAYLDTLPGKPAPTEDEVQGFFLSHGEERHVFHVLCKTEVGAKAARQRLEKGEAFEKVADAFSIDPSAKKNHGDIGWIKREAAVAEFAKVAFSAKEGELSAPFQSQFGWHVLLVKARRTPTAADFEKQKVALMAQAKDLVNGPRREEALKALRTQYPLSVDQAALAVNPTPLTAAVDAKRIAGKVGGVGLTLKELDAFIFDTLGGAGPDHALSPAAKQRFLELMADDHRLVLAAEKAGLEGRPEVRAQIWQAQRAAVHQGFSVNYLRSLKVSDADLSAHLNAHPDRFLGVGAVRMNLLVASDQASADRAAVDAAKGTPWKTLVVRHANAASTGNWEPGFLEVGALQKLLPAEALKALQTKPLESVVGPVPGPEGPMLFKILERRPGPVQPLDQCRDAVREDYIKTRGAELVEAYLGGEGQKDLRIQVYAGNSAR